MTQIRNIIVGICLAVSLLIAPNVSARDEWTVEPENVEISASLELDPDGNFHLDIDATASIPGEEIEQLPLTSADLEIGISSPNSGQLRIDLDGSATFTESGLTQLPLENMPAMTAEILNLMLQGVKGKYLSEIIQEMTGQEAELPPEIEDLKVDDIRFTEFSWDGPTLTIGLTVTISGSVFEDEEALGELPLTITISFEGSEKSLSLNINGNTRSADFDLSLNATKTDGSWDINLSIVADGTLPDFKEKGLRSFEIPAEARELLGEQDLGDIFEGQKITFKLKVPEGTDISGLPGGYDYSEGTYTWTDSGAAGALESLMTGEAGFEGEPSETEELPWLWIGVGIAIIAAGVVATLVIRR